MDEPGITYATSYLYQFLLQAVLSTVCGLIISQTYRITSRELIHSQGFMQTVIATTVIVSIIVKSATELQTAFVVVGILSILRFRTVVRDTAEFTFILLAFAAAIAIGTEKYLLAILGTLCASAVVFFLYRFEYGSYSASPIRLRVRAPLAASEDLNRVLRLSAKEVQCVAIQRLEGEVGTFCYEFLLLKGSNIDQLVHQIRAVPGTEAISSGLLRREGSLKDLRE
ncbi:DUF4956 domain-containing protein [Bradyrhizobium sp. 151]|uniref:DUF4956 domain-containing protein n=1 Tax=Bradyrhizobium sp. 151 TaxID=2782626 RepID=UPI001FFBDB00|nr:DUF4956 domain-containing protein [Bradyrhizobium sp. 151]MCK1658478.1 hypothetical protein [Bradyrhizobium sp. 151]